MPSAQTWESWVPVFAPLVTGRYTARVWDGQQYDEQQVEARCSSCGESMATRCFSGRPREKITKWALLHLHAGPRIIGA